MVIKVTGSNIKIIKDELVVTGSLNAYEIYFEFDKSWREMTCKTAVFYQPSVNRNSPTYRIIDEEKGLVIIPEDSLVKDDYLYIGVFGFNEDSTKRIPTIYTYTYVKTGCYAVEQAPVPDPSVYEQIYNIALNAVQVANSVRADANAGKFDGYSPTINVKEETEDTYILSITTKDETFETPNLKGERGSDGGDKHFAFVQSVPSDVWIIEHKLDKYPSVSIIDSANTAIIGEVRYIDTDKLEVHFTSKFSGKAYLN